MNQIDLFEVLNDLLKTFPFIHRHIKQNFEKYPKKREASSQKTHQKLLKFMENLKELKTLFSSLKIEQETLISFMQKTFRNLLESIVEKSNEFWETHENEKKNLFSLLDSANSQTNEESVKNRKELQEEKTLLENMKKVNENERNLLIEEKKC